MGAPKRMPSFSQRPGFPSGLRVLLVDSDPEARARTEEQLRECDYTVTSCASCAEAIVQLSSCSSMAFDVLLADKSAIGCAAVAAADAGGRCCRSGLLDSCKGVPCILMGKDPSPNDVMQGISLGAVDFLAKPLSQLKLRNIWQHTVRKMMADMQICSGSGTSKGAAPAIAAAASHDSPCPAPRAPCPAAPHLPAHLDRSASNLPDLLADDHQQQQQQQQQQADASPAAAPSAAVAPSNASLPPRSPGARQPAPINGRTPGATHLRLHSCISSTNLAASGPSAAPLDDELDFDFDAAEAARIDAMAGAQPEDSPCPTEQQQAAPSATATATATATHISVPAPSCVTAAPAPSCGTAPTAATATTAMAPSCGVPVAGALAPLSAGMVWGMPMPVVRAPGIVPPKGAAPMAPTPPPAAAWGYMGCAMPPAFMMPPPFMMMVPPQMCSTAPGGYAGAYGAPCMYMQQPQQQQQHHGPTGAAAAQALDASLMSLLGSAEDDLDVDFDDVLQDIGVAATSVSSRQRAAADECCGAGAAGAALGGVCEEVRFASSPGSLGSTQEALLPRVDSAGLLQVGGGSDLGEDEFDADAFLGSCGTAAAQMCGGLGLEDWGDTMALKKSGSLADLLAGPLAVA